MARLFPDDPPRFLETPYGYPDPSAELSEAGWEDVQLDPLFLETHAGSALDVALGVATGSPLSFQLSERGADPAAVAAELARDLAPVGGERPFRAELAATVITATR